MFRRWLLLPSGRRHCCCPRTARCPVPRSRRLWATRCPDGSTERLCWDSPQPPNSGEIRCWLRLLTENDLIFTRKKQPSVQEGRHNPQGSGLSRRSSSEQLVTVVGPGRHRAGVSRSGDKRDGKGAARCCGRALFTDPTLLVSPSPLSFAG